MNKSKFRLRQQLLFFLERQFIKGAHYQLLSVAMLIGLITLIGGLLMLPLSEADSVDGFGESLWWAFLRLTDPGYLGDDVGTWKRLISTVLTVAGYVVFLGALVAIMTQWLNSKMRTLEQGLTPVAAQNHILILGWNNRTLPVIGELLSSTKRLKRFLKRYGSRKLQLVLMIDNVTSQRVQELKDDKLLANHFSDITLRSGNPLDVEHLQRVNAPNALAIIIPSHTTAANQSISADVETFKILLSLSDQVRANDHKKLPYVVSEIQDEGKSPIARRAYNGPLEVVAGDAIISRLMAQNVRHEGLSEVYKELLSRSVNNNIFIREIAGFEGNKMSAIEAAFPNVIMLGVVRWVDNEFVPHLNLTGRFIFNKNDRLVLLARSYEDTDPKYKGIQKFNEKRIKSANNSSLKPAIRSISKKVLILGWNQRIPSLISEFGTYEKEKYKVDMVSLVPNNIREKLINQHGGFTSRVQCHHIEMDYTVETDLRNIAPDEYDNIILASSDRLSDDEEADARSIVGYLLLEYIFDNQANRPQILLELFDPNNESLIENHHSEVIISPLILSRLLAQVAMRRELHAIYNELFTVGGAEIIFRDPTEYGLSLRACQFSELKRLAASHNETALGIYKKPLKNERKGTLIMNPPEDSTLEIEEHVKLVILTTY